MDDREKLFAQRMAKRRRNTLILRSIIAALILVMLILAGILIKVGIIDGEFKKEWDRAHRGGAQQEGQSAQLTPDEDETGAQEDAVSRQEEILAQAAFLAAQYDYSSALTLLQTQEDYFTNTAYQNAVAQYEDIKKNCISYPVDEVTHIFFHTLIKDTDKAFDGDEKEAGYNQVMTTISEFNSIMQQMYERGYVMVSVHDMCEVHEDGSVTKKEIWLPEGKKPFVLSQDDVSYYHYMDGDGFAARLIIDENGEIKNTYLEDDGTVSVGDYDMVPLIDTFVKEHPDFSYHGHKGIIALTGYEGVLGYRTDEVYKTRQEDRLTQYQRAFLAANPDFDFEKEVAEATAVAQAMKADGWEFASHTWGHINPLGYGFDATVRDTERFLSNVVPVIGETDVLIFAFGADIGDWTPYTDSNQFYTYLKGKGFSIFCNVDASREYWVQFGTGYMRQGRRNLDGYRMYYTPDLCADLFSVEQAWDESRPTPVPEL